MDVIIATTVVPDTADCVTCSIAYPVTCKVKLVDDGKKIIVRTV